MLEIPPVWLNGNNQVKEIGTNFPHSDVNNSLTVLWTSGGQLLFHTGNGRFGKLLFHNKRLII